VLKGVSFVVVPLVAASDRIVDAGHAIVQVRAVRGCERARGELRKTPSGGDEVVDAGADPGAGGQKYAARYPARIRASTCAFREPTSRNFAAQARA
jgi:hypothetical protein